MALIQHENQTDFHKLSSFTCNHGTLVCACTPFQHTHIHTQKKNIKMYLKVHFKKFKNAN